MLQMRRDSARADTKGIAPIVTHVHFIIVVTATPGGGQEVDSGKYVAVRDTVIVVVHAVVAAGTKVAGIACAVAIAVGLVGVGCVEAVVILIAHTIAVGIGETTLVDLTVTVIVFAIAYFRIARETVGIVVVAVALGNGKAVAVAVAAFVHHAVAVIVCAVAGFNNRRTQRKHRVHLVKRGRQVGDTSDGRAGCAERIQPIG